MIPAQSTLEIDRLRELQCLLQLYEAHHGPICGVAVLRKHVLEQMRRLMPYVPILALLLLTVPAIGQEHRHGDETIYGATGRFYETWDRPDMPGASCCNRHDCDTAVDVKQIEGQWWARKKGGGALMSIPADKVEQRRDSPDGQSHLCAIGSTVLCFIAGAGG